MSSSMKSMKLSVLPDEIDNNSYVATNEIIYGLISDHSPNLSKEHKEQIVKYGIIREQKNGTLCKSLEIIFNDGFELTEKKT